MKRLLLLLLLAVGPCTAQQNAVRQGPFANLPSASGLPSGYTYIVTDCNNTGTSCTAGGGTYSVNFTIVSSAWAPQPASQATADVDTPSALVAFRKALADSATQVVRIKVFGDSISRCQNTNGCATGPNDPNSLWPNALRNAIANAGYISHGTGILPLMVSGGTGAIDSLNWTVAGTTAQSTIIGPQQAPSGCSPSGCAAFSTLIRMSPSATATMATQSGTKLVVYCAEYTDSSSGLNVNIDSVNVGTACGSTNSSALALDPSFTVSSGAHSVVLTSNGTGNAYLYGAEWVSNTYGVAVDNYSVGSAMAMLHNGHFDFSDLATGDALAILPLGTNEAEYSEQSTFSTNLTGIASHEIARGASVLIFAEPPCNNNSCSSVQPTIISTMQSVAQSNGYAYTSAYAQWPSYTLAQSWGLFSADNLHPNDSGQLTLAALANYNVLGAAASNTAVSQFIDGTLLITESASSNGFNPLLTLYNGSTTSGADTNMEISNVSHRWRLGVAKTSPAAGNFYLYDKTNSNYALTFDNSSSPSFTTTGNYASGYIKNSGTGNNAFAGWVFQGNARTFVTGVGNSTETVYGCASKWCIYDYTASALRASMDSTGIYDIKQGVQVPAQAFASWTACSSTYDGTIARISDSTVTTGNVTVGGGSNVVDAICNGAVPAYQVIGGSGGGAPSTPGTTTTGNVPQYSNTSGTALSTGLGVVTSVGSPGSNSNVPTEEAVSSAIAAISGVLPSYTSVAGYLVTNGTTSYWGNIVTGGSGALDCATTPGVCDIVTAVVPLKASANVLTGLNKQAPATAATSGANQTANPFEVESNYWNGTASSPDDWWWNTVLGTGSEPTTTFTLNHTGGSGTATVNIPFQISVSGCSGCGVGSFTGDTTTAASSTGALTPGDCAEWDASGNIIDAGSPCGSGGSPAFSALTGSTNTTAAMVLGSGASLAATGGGTITATSVPGSGVTGTVGTAQLPTTMFVPPYMVVGGNYYLPNDAGYQATKPTSGITSWSNAALVGMSTASAAAQTNGDYLVTGASSSQAAYYYQTSSLASIETVSQGTTFPTGGSQGLFLQDSSAGTGSGTAYLDVCYTTGGMNFALDTYYNNSGTVTYAAEPGILHSSGMTANHLKLSVSGTTATCQVSTNGGVTYVTVGTHTITTPVIKMGLYVAGNMDVSSLVLH